MSKVMIILGQYPFIDSINPGTFKKTCRIARSRGIKILTHVISCMVKYIPHQAGSTSSKTHDKTTVHGNRIITAFSVFSYLVLKFAYVKLVSKRIFSKFNIRNKLMFNDLFCLAIIVIPIIKVTCCIKGLHIESGFNSNLFQQRRKIRQQFFNL